MKIESRPSHGYGPHTYAVSTRMEWNKMFRWLEDNKVNYWLVSISPREYMFQIRDKQDWFILRWL